MSEHGKDDVAEQFLARVRDRKDRDRNLPAVAGLRRIDQSRYRRLQAQELRETQLLVARKRVAGIEREAGKWSERVGSRWADAALSKLSDPGAIAAIEDRLGRFKHKDGMNRISLVFSGSNGGGKTYAAYAYVRELIDGGFIRNSQIFLGNESSLSNIASAGFRRDEMRAELLHPRHRLYFIDEVGRGAFGSPVARGQVWDDLMDHVYSNQLCIVLTTNLKTNTKNAPDAISSWITGAGIERLRHMVGIDGNVVMNGKNYRKELGDHWESEYKSRRRA